MRFTENGNILEVLQGMAQQQQKLQESLLLRELLDDSGLPPAEKAKIRTQFRESFDVVKVQEAIEAAQANLKEAARAEPPKVEEPELPVTPPAVRGAGYDYQKTKDRWNVFREGQLLGNFATKAEADAAVARDQRTRDAQTQAAQQAADERYATQLKLAECKLLLRETLDDSGLPLTAQEKIAKQFTGRVFEESELQEAINDTWDMLSPLIGTGNVMLPGQERGLRQARVVEDEYDKLCTAFDGFWAGENLKTKSGTVVPRFRRLSEAYTAFMKKPWNALTAFNEAKRMTEGAHYDSHDRYGVQSGRHLQEAILSTSWPQILGDSITRRMLAEYSVPNLQIWRNIVSEISTITDFRTQRRMRYGGYGTLPVVPENVPYVPLPSPTDQEAQYAIQKRGGLESLTLEAMANDDVGSIRRIPQRLGRSAAQTLFRLIFDIFANNQALTYDDDQTALFTEAHGNYLAGVNPLNAANMDVMIQTFAQQTAYGNTVEFLGLRPRYLLHASALWRNAWKLTNTQLGEPGTTDNDANPYLQFGIQPLQIDYWTNANLWVGVANPADIPTIEVGFFQGNEDPELFVADQDTIGGSSQFNADVIQWKIRHIYGAAVLDHRAFFATGF